MAKQNVLTRSKKAKAEEAFRSNRLAEAKALYASVCQSDRTDADAWVKLGIINRKLQDFVEAETCCRRALALLPRCAEAHLALGAALQCQRRIEEGLAAYHAAIAFEPRLAEAHYFLANALKDRGALSEAVMHYKEAVALKPNFLEALSNLGAALTLLCNIKEATEYLNRADKIQPNVPQVLCNMGSILMMDSRFDEARDKFQKALAYAPDSVDALSKLADLSERTSRLEEAKPLVERGLTLDPGNATLNLVAAKISRSENRPQDAIALLEKIPIQSVSTETAVDIHLSLGKLYDRVGDAKQAFQHITEGNRLVEQTMLREDQRGENYWRKIDQMAKYLSEGLGESLPTQSPPDGRQTPIFLMGFARSGTTLLDQILDSHPSLQGMEEKPSVEAMAKAFLAMVGDRPDALANLTRDEIEHLRKVYFDTVAQHVKLAPDRTLVDKMPLNTASAHLIWRIFPNAKFIFAVRHPCDVCLSCFMQNFALNEAMSNFLTLESTARLYARVIDLWVEYARRLPIDYHQVRYEDLVADFEGETRKLLEFLDVGWDDAVRGYTENARKNTITTPSYHQVTQPIYQHAKYRWKRYARQMEPVMEILKPYIDYFGYAEE